MKNFHKTKKTTVGELTSKLSEFSADKRIERFEIVFETLEGGYYLMPVKSPDKKNEL
ncbi:MAG: hypothetical protein LBF89_10115 [Bacteroidales bacterium]|jgi:hypothetical protein|nr:hypothetical protein [Bacteroidales bacterium]